MRRNAFFGYLVAEVIVIVAVTLIFKFISNRQIAATLAGFLFLILPIAIMWLEYRRAHLKHLYWFISVLQFLLLFAVPIFFLRMLNWGVPFEQLSFLGVPGTTLHQWSSKSYMVMMLFTVWNWWKS
ncbi:MAG: hypothetical protein ACXWRG_08880 [Bdellovibrio sp.]